jgi:hypothetical protein
LTKSEHRWERILDTADTKAEAKQMNEGDIYEIQGRSLTVLRIVMKEPEPAPTISTVQVESLLKEQRTASPASERPALVSGS